MTGPARFHVVIPAAGAGLRMGAREPKQYLAMAGRTVLEHAVAPFLAHPSMVSLVIVLAPDDHRFAGTGLGAAANVRTTVGGATRSESVAAGLAAIDEADGDTPVLVHDAARPCLPVSDIDPLLAACGPSGALLAVPVQDTLKRADDSGRVAGTVDRERLWHALTPQAFPLATLRRALADCTASITDEAQAMEHAGFAPRLVEADVTNFKITRPGDLELAAMILAGRRQGAVT